VPGYCRSRASRRCCGRPGAARPFREWLKHRFNGLDDDPDTRRLIAASVAIEQVQELERQGVRDLTSYLESGRADFCDLSCTRSAAPPASSEP